MPNSGRLRPRAKHDVHLVRTHHVDDREQRADSHVRQRFLHGLARSRLLYCFAVLHEAGRNGPEAVPRLDGALAQQDLAFHLDDTAGDDARVLIVNRAARRADVPRQVIAFGNLELDGWPQAGQNFMAHAETRVDVGILTSLTRPEECGVDRRGPDD